MTNQNAQVTSSTHRNDWLSLVLVASPQSQPLFHQPTPEYSINNSRSTPSNTETHASKNPTSLSRHTKTKSQKIEFENLFSNLSLTSFKTVADPFAFPLQRTDGDSDNPSRRRGLHVPFGSTGKQVSLPSPGASGVVADFSRFSLPTRTSRPAATCVHVNQDTGPISCRPLYTGFALRQYENPFRQKGPALTGKGDRSHCLAGQRMRAETFLLFEFV